jgi:hypothetical protein
MSTIDLLLESEGFMAMCAFTITLIIYVGFFKFLGWQERCKEKKG